MAGVVSGSGNNRADEPRHSAIVAPALTIAGALGGGVAQEFVPHAVPLIARIILEAFCTALGLALAAGWLLFQPFFRTIDGWLRRVLPWTVGLATLAALVLGTYFKMLYSYSINPKCDNGTITVPSETTSSSFDVTTLLKCVSYGHVAVTALEMRDPHLANKTPLYYLSWATATGDTSVIYRFAGDSQGPGIKRTFFLTELPVDFFVRFANDPHTSFGAAHTAPEFIKALKSYAVSDAVSTITKG